MKKLIFITTSLVGMFFLGFAFRGIVDKQPTQTPRATGIGGIFFKSKDPKKLRDWYKAHLGLQTNAYGAVFEWRQGADTSQKGFTQWSPFNEKTKYFEPSGKEFMINYRVEGLDALLEQFKRDSITILDKVETADYGRFVHILDLEGNKLELWEPNDIEFEKLGVKIGATTTK